MNSRNSSHGSRGCSPNLLKASGGAGLLYCVLANYHSTSPSTKRELFSVAAGSVLQHRWARETQSNERYH
jgi:hypothetical protein